MAIISICMPNYYVRPETFGTTLVDCTRLSQRLPGVASRYPEHRSLDAVPMLVSKYPSLSVFSTGSLDLAAEVEFGTGGGRFCGHCSALSAHGSLV